VQNDSDPERKAYRLRVLGRVQGVGFRYHVITHAQELGLDGYARNLDDGTVEVWAEGKLEALDELLEATRRGPRWARVDEVLVERVTATHTCRGFTVRH
jgi:acylphosphatase